MLFLRCRRKAGGDRAQGLSARKEDAFLVVGGFCGSLGAALAEHAPMRWWKEKLE